MAGSDMPQVDLHRTDIDPAEAAKARKTVQAFSLDDEDYAEIVAMLGIAA